MKGILHYYDERGMQWEISRKGSHWFAQPNDGSMGIHVTAFHDGAAVLIEQIDERE